MDIQPWMVVCENNLMNHYELEIEVHRFADQLKAFAFAEKQAEIFQTVTVCRCVQQRDTHRGTQVNMQEQ